MMYLTKMLLIPSLCISYSLAEAPYPAAGWRPQRPFNLPTDYLPPPQRDIEKQQQPHFAVGVSQERVDFAGQIQSNILSEANRQPANAYLPPRKHNTDFFEVQQPPYKSSGQQFVSQFVGKRPQQQQQTQIFQIIDAQQEQLFGDRLPVQSVQQTAQRPQQQFFSEEQQEFYKPAEQYGPPSGVQEQQVTINQPDPRHLKQGDSQPLNAATEAYNRQQEELANNVGADQKVEAAARQADADYPTARGTRGQYYVLGPDNRLQLVRFTTAQSAEEARGDGGFTAQLRYTPVGEINDPIFKYNNRGQLVRI